MTNLTVANQLTLLRMLLIPAVMHMAGDAAWWLPRWLDRLLPNVDVEGAELERTHPHTPAVSAEPDPEGEPELVAR